MSVALKNALVQPTFAKLYLNNELADFHFTTQDEKIPVNKSILAAMSTVFDSQFFGSMKEKGNSAEIDLASPEAFKEFLQFFYLTEVTLTPENVEEVMKLVDYYDMLDDVNICFDHRSNQLTGDNILWGYHFAIILKNGKLKKYCEKLIGITILDIFDSDAFICCDQQVLKSILKIDTLSCKEVDVLDACLKWAKYACQKNGLDETNDVNLRTQLDACFNLIRFGALKFEELAAYCVLHENLLTFEDHKNIMYEIATFKTTPRSIPPELIESETRENNTLYISRDQNNGPKLWVNPASFKFRFSVNETLLLRELSFVGIFGWDGTYTQRNFDVKIVEMSIESNTERVIFASSFQAYFIGNYMSLDRSHVVYPQKLYEIRYETFDHRIVYYKGKPFKSEYYLKDKPLVKIHPTDSDHGLILSLRFQKI